MSDITLKAILSGDASSFNSAVSSAADMVTRWREETAQAAAVGQRFEEALKSQGVAIDEWAKAMQAAAEKEKEAQEQSQKLQDIFADALGVGAALTGFGLLTEALDLAKEGFEKITIGAMEYGHATEIMAAKLGMTTDQVQKLQYAADVTGGNVNSLARSILNMQAGIESGSSKVLGALAALKLDAQDMASAGTDEAINKISEALKGVDENAQRIDLKNLLGRGAIENISLFTSNLKELEGQAESTGAVLDEQTIKQLADNAKAWIAAKDAVSGFFNALGGLVGSVGVSTWLDQMAGGLGVVTEKLQQLTTIVRKLKGGEVDTTDVSNLFSMQSIYKPPGAPSPGKDFSQTGTDAENAAADKAAEKWLLAEEKKDAAQAKRHEKELDRIAREEQAADDAAAKWLANEEKKENDANEAAAAWLKRQQAQDLKGEIELTREAADTKKQQQDLDTQFAQSFVASLKNEHTEAIKLANDFEGVGAILSQLPGMMAALGVSTDSVASKLVSMGAGLASGLGGFLKTLGDPSANIFSKISSGIGLAASAVSAIAGLFGHDEGKAIGNDLGGNISKGLIDAIKSTETKDHLGRALAEDLNLDAVLKETGADPATMADRINHLMEAVAGGAVPAQEGVAELGKLFNDLKTAADGGSVASEAAMVKMIQRAKELGEHIPEIDAAIGKMLDDAMAGLKDFYSGLTPGAGGAKQGAASQQLFGALYAAQAQTGLAEAYDKYKDLFDEMKKSLAPGTKLTGDAAEFARLEKLMENKEFSGAARGAEGLAKATTGLMDTGNLSQRVVDAVGRSLETLYDQALHGAGAAGMKGGKAEDAALKAVLPELVALQKAQALGAKLTPKESEMLAQAQAKHLLPMLDVQTQQLLTQKQIERNTAGGRGSTTSGGYVHAASGFYSPSMPAGPLDGGGTPMVVHPGEKVSVTPAGQHSSRGEVHVSTPVSINAGTIVGNPEDIIGMVTDALKSRHPDLMAAVQLVTLHG